MINYIEKRMWTPDPHPHMCFPSELMPQSWTSTNLLDGSISLLWSVISV